MHMHMTPEENPLGIIAVLQDPHWSYFGTDIIL